jgi:hypothetical protein
MQDLRKKEKLKNVYTDHLPKINYKNLLKKSIWIGSVVILAVLISFPYQIGYIIGKWWNLFLVGFSGTN